MPEPKKYDTWDAVADELLAEWIDQWRDE